MAGVHIDLGPAGIVLTVGAVLLVVLRLALWAGHRHAVRRTRALLDDLGQPPPA